MSQKALFLTEAKGAWKIDSRPIPEPGPGELVVKIQSTALNPVDWKIQAYNFFITEYPTILGTDSAGIVEAVGEGVSGFAKGDEVFHQGAFTLKNATFQQYTVVPAEITAKKPSNISFDEAASIPLGLATAVQGLYGDRKSPDIFKVTPPWEEGGSNAAKGKTIVILGGSSSVGQYVILLAKLSGFSSIITTASLHNAPFLESLGATAVVDRKAADVRAELTKAAKGAPIDVVYDAISLQDTQEVAWDVLAPSGTLVLVLPPSVERAKYVNKKVVDDVFGNVHAPHLRALGVSLYKALPRLIETSAIKPNRVEVLPNGLNGIGEGLARMQADKVSGVKLIAHPQETA